MKFYLGLVHHPIKNKKGDMVTTSVTNLDIHDISRTCKTFGIEQYFIITPLKPQTELVNSILGHWEKDSSNNYNPDRHEALSIAKTVSSVEDAIAEISKIEGKTPFVVGTGANFETFDGDIKELTKKLEIFKMPCFLLFGTGWGLHETILHKTNFKLAPIVSRKSDGYNHLSVRSAVAIYLDRLFGE